MQINFLGIIVAAATSMAVGFLWYSPVLFGNMWIKLMGWTKSNSGKKKSDMGKIYMVSMVGAVITAYVLSQFIGLDTVENLKLGFWLWLGFVAPVQLTEVLFGGKSVALFAINTGYQLASILTMAAVLSWL